MKLGKRKRNQQFWNEFIESTYPLLREFEFLQIPEESSKFVVMVEPREHPHLEYVLRNVMHFLGPGWGLQLFVGQSNKVFVEEIVKDWKHVHIYQIETDNLSALEYNQLKKYPSFWQMVKGEHILWIETDCLLRHGNIDPFLKYDYVGAPWVDWMALSKEVSVGNGGLSLRNRSAMIDIGSSCNIDTSIFPQEDLFYTINMHLQGDRFQVAEKEIAKKFAVESVYYENPLGLHKAWKYLPEEQLQSLLNTIDYSC